MSSSESQISKLKAPKPIVHSRDSSIDSRTSSNHSNSTDYTYKTSSSRESTVEAGERRVQIHRVPDNEDHTVITTLTQGDRVLIHDHKARHYDPAEPRSSEASSEDFKLTHLRSVRPSDSTK